MSNGQVLSAPRDPPFKVPDISPPAPLAATAIFHSRYAGWTIRKGIADGCDDGPIRSWRTPVVAPLTFSSEELFLQVVSQVAKNGKKDRSLKTVYDGLRSQNQRNAIDWLINQQNQLLQGWDPLLEWKLAGLQLKMHRLNQYFKETALIMIILKTELRLQGDSKEPNPHDPARSPFAWSPRPASVVDPPGAPAPSNSAKDPNRRPQSNTGIRVQRRGLQILQESPHLQTTDIYRKCRKGKGQAGDSDGLRRESGYYPGPQDTNITVQDEDDRIDSLLADWEEVVNIWSTRTPPSTSFNPPSTLPRSELPHREVTIRASGASRRYAVRLPTGKAQRQGRKIRLEMVIGISGRKRTATLG